MNSLRETVQQIRLSAVLISGVAIFGIVGFMVFEGEGLLNAIWMTVITLTTIGYGDIVPETVMGRVFNLILIIVGISIYAFAIQAVANLISSPAIRNLRQQARIRREVAQLKNHFIICGAGQLIDKIIEMTEHIAQTEYDFSPSNLSRIRLLFMSIKNRLLSTSPDSVARDAVVVVTEDKNRVSALHAKSLRAIKGSPTDDQVLQDAGVERARAMVVTLDDDAASLLTVLTARQYNSRMLITTAILDSDMRPKITRVGGNSVVLPYEIGGYFLNMATLRPAVSDFFNQILLNQIDGLSTTQLPIRGNSPWVGRTLNELQIRERFDAAIMAVLTVNGRLVITPPPDYTLQAEEILIVVLPFKSGNALVAEATGDTPLDDSIPEWQRLSLSMEQMAHPHQYLPDEELPSPDEGQHQIDDLAHHFVICADGRAGREAVKNLDPARPFVIITSDEAYADLLRHQGFRVVHGNPAHESILCQSGIERALSIMVTMEDEADSVLAVLTARELNKTLNITAAAYNPLMENKLKRAGADRVATPLKVAAQFIILATVRPVVIDFFHYVVFNREAGIETTELYMQHDSPFIGMTIAETKLKDNYEACVIGVRHANGQFLPVPPLDYQVQDQEVLIVVTPMRYADELRVVTRRDRTGQLTQLPRPNL